MADKSKTYGKNRILDWKKNLDKLLKMAEEKVDQNAGEMYHCSEATFIAINDTLKLIEPSLVRAITGFHGGGGNHRLDPSINLTEALEGVLSGRDKRPREELPFVGTGHMCGALAAGVFCLGLVYGRESSKDDLTCIDELSYEFHRRFQETFKYKECANLYEGEEKCAKIMKFSAKTAIEMIINAENIIPECRGACKLK